MVVGWSDGWLEESLAVGLPRRSVRLLAAAGLTRRSLSPDRGGGGGGPLISVEASPLKRTEMGRDGRYN